MDGFGEVEYGVRDLSDTVEGVFILFFRFITSCLIYLVDGLRTDGMYGLTWRTKNPVSEGR